MKRNESLKLSHHLYVVYSPGHIYIRLHTQKPNAMQGQIECSIEDFKLKHLNSCKIVVVAE